MIFTSHLKLLKLVDRRERNELGWVGHVAGVGKRKTHTGFWWVRLKERDYLVDPGTGERIRMCGLHSLQQRDKWRALRNKVMRLLYLRKD